VVATPPSWIAATRLMTAEVDEILDSVVQPVQRSRARRVNFDAFDEGIALEFSREATGPLSLTSTNYRQNSR
jgi:hypothetical protein